MKNESLLMIISFLIITLNSLAQVTDTFTDSRDGKKYKIIKIGTQTWMAENLAFKINSGCWACDNNLRNVAIYGYLYNWKTAIRVCPTGWHLPSDNEWQALTDYLGGDELAGGKLKSVKGWNNPNTGATNSSGFSALPGSSREYAGISYVPGDNGFWWTATTTKTDVRNAWDRLLTKNGIDVDRGSLPKVCGLSVRCLKN